MSYSAQAQLSQDENFRLRIAACAAVEVRSTHQPYKWADDHIWWVAAAPGFAAAYESALVANVDTPGKDPAVISDAQILSVVQQLATVEGTKK